MMNKIRKVLKYMWKNGNNNYTSDDLRTYFKDIGERTLDGGSKGNWRNKEHSMNWIGEIRVDYSVKLR